VVDLKFANGLDKADRELQIEKHTRTLIFIVRLEIPKFAPRLPLAAGEFRYRLTSVLNALAAQAIRTR